MSELLRRAAWIARAWRGNRAWLLLMVFMTALSAGSTLAYPLVFGHVLERVRELGQVQGLPGADLRDEVHRLIAVLLAVGLARGLASLYPGLRGFVNLRLELVVRARAFARLLGQGPAFFATYRTGDLVTRLTDDIAGYPKIAWFCCSGIFRALDSSARIACCLGVMLWLDPRLALTSLIPVPLMVGLFLLLKRQLGAATKAQREASSATSDLLEASFTGAQVVQAHAAEARLGDALRRQLDQRSTAELDLARLWVLLTIFFQALNVVGQLVVVVAGGLRVIDGSLELGVFFSFYLYLGLLLGPLMDLPNLFVTGRQAAVCMDRLDEVEAAPAEKEPWRADAPAPAGFTSLELADVTVRHGSAAGEGARPPALRGLDLTLRRGEKLAVVGEVGSGKSTLTRLVAGACAPDQGLVRWDGRPRSEWSRAGLRAAIGWVPQEPVLFATTVRENVLMGRPEDPVRLRRALEAACVLSEVQALPQGLDQELGVRGKGLSGGQRQRLGIARALYGDPSLLVLDDVTAALDAENEARFWDRLGEGWPGTTVLVVTHREATARRMDRTLQLAAGQLMAGQLAAGSVAASGPAPAP